MTNGFDHLLGLKLPIARTETLRKGTIVVVEGLNPNGSINVSYQGMAGRNWTSVHRNELPDDETVAALVLTR